MPIYKETRKEKLPKDGRCYYFKCYYTDMYGKKKQKKSKKYKTKKEAEQAERDFLSKVQCENISISGVLFEEAYEDWWNQRKKALKSTTIYGLNCTLRKYFFNDFKGIKLKNIKMPLLDSWVETLQDKNIAQSFKKKIFCNMKLMFNFCVVNYNFDPKLVSKIIQPKDEEVQQISESRWNFLTDKQFEEFLNVVDEPEYNLIFQFLYYTGLRWGEFSALTWNDIDLEKGTLQINKTLTNKLGIGAYRITTPKTKNSNRTILLDDELLKLVNDHYKSEKKILGFNRGMFIFGNSQPLNSSTVRRHLNEYLEKANIPCSSQYDPKPYKRITLHGFRHSHASLLIELGLDSRQVAERLGDTIDVVENTYIHLFPQKITETVNAINRMKLSKIST